MADKYIQIPAQEGGPFSDTVNIVNFTIPSGAVYDLYDSFVTFKANLVTPTDTSTDYSGAALPGCVYQVGLKQSATDTHCLNASLVKNASMRCQARGQLENVRRVDQIQDALSTLDVGLRENHSWAYLSANTLADLNGFQHYGVFTLTQKTGATASSYKEAQIQIRLGDLLDLCNTRAFDARRLGETTIRMEMNFNLFEPYVLGEQVVPPGVSNCNDIAPFAAVGSVTQLVTTASAPRTAAGNRGIRSLRDSPFWVGAKIQVTTATVVAAAPAIQGQDFRVTSIAVSDTGAITIGIFPPIPMVANDGYTGITVSVLGNGAKVTLNGIDWNTAEVTLKQLGAPPPIDMPMDLVYSTWSTIQDVGPTNVTSFQRAYDIPADADGVVVCFPESATGGIASINQNIDSYRLRCNHVDLTDRDVAVDSPLYYDRMAAGLGAMGFQVRNLSQNTGNSNTVGSMDVITGTAADKKTYIVSKLPQTAMPKSLQLNAELSGNQIGALSIFAHRPRRISL
jgi:hypothetical protein